MNLLKHRLFRIFLYVSIVLFLILGLTVAALLLAVKSKPKFYAKSLQVERSILARKSREATEKTTETFAKLTPLRSGWETKYTEDEINGYLAVDLARDHPKILPPEIKDPRISLQNEKLEFACQIENGTFTGVLNLVMDVKFPQTNRCEIRFQVARLGLLPFSRETVRDLLADGFRQSGVKVETPTIEGDPALVLDFQIPIQEKKLSLLLESLTIENGEISFSGAVEKLKK